MADDRRAREIAIITGIMLRNSDRPPFPPTLDAIVDRVLEVERRANASATIQLDALRAVAEAAAPFARVANIADALPNGHKLPNDAEPGYFAPKGWPSLSAYRALRDALDKAREAGR